MNNNIIRLSQIESHKNFLGSKTLNLKKCADWGFNVPVFIALPCYLSKILIADKIFRKKIAEKSAEILGKEKYAVRSSALIEDSANHSYAGQFLTKTDLSANELERAIFQVIKQAEIFLHGDVGKFSLIIQEYIDANISGVAFTRNPAGAREMIIEYGYCPGEKIVAGEIKPSKISFYWNDQTIKLPKFFAEDQIVGKFKELENKSGFPQDIEWCIRNKQFYLLQARSITTISRKQYNQILFLDGIFPKGEKYYFEKTEISEFAPRPATVTCDLLRSIYSDNGPVSKVYKKVRVLYKDTAFLAIIGNELFIDKEKEIQGILPSYSYLSGKDLTPKFCSLSGSFPTCKNLFSLNRIRTDSYEKIFTGLKIKIEAEKLLAPDPKTALDNFLHDYELIFETNLLSGLAIKKVNLLLKNEPVTFIEILSGYSDFIDPAKYQVNPPRNLKGNSIELSDGSDFTAIKNIKHEATKKITDWQKKIPGYKKEMMQSIITEAIIYNRLRELGRWLAIKNINILRASLLDHAKRKNFKDATNIYFTGLDNILNNTASESGAIKNRTAYEKYNHFDLPNIITSSLIIKKSELLGVSSGLAVGILDDRKFTRTPADKKEKIILCTEMLSPDLTRYFDRISGIVSDNGGLLSHLAIMAREKNIPVIVGYSITTGQFKLGDKVQIDGSSGKIIKF